ncbi:MAG: glycosyltransferase family 4 protein [Treponema sp.]|nr:glycosyltransferase family 4 protein [Treponema sp.]
MIKLLFTASRSSHIMQFHKPYINYYLSYGIKVFTAAQGEVEIPNVEHENIIFEKRNIFKNLKSIFKVRNLIKNESIDIVISNATLAGFITRLAVFTLFKKPRVIHSCHGYLFSNSTKPIKRFILIFIEKLLSPVTNIVLTMNTEDFAAAKKYKFSKKILNIPGIGYTEKPKSFVKTEETLKQENLYRNFIDIENVFTLVYAAEISARKNQTQLVELITPLFLKHPNWRLILAGDGVLEEELKKKIKTLNMQDKIIMTGFVKDINGLLSSAQAVISTSKSEGLPFNILDAMSLGIPVIASNIKGHSDLINDGQNGFLFSLKEPFDLEFKLEQLENNLSLRLAFIENAKKSADYFSIKRVFDIVLSAYAEVDSRLHFANN